MHVLIIDQDELNSQMLCNRVEALGHKATYKKAKSEAMESLSLEAIDLVFLDPAPLTNARPLILNIRNNIGGYIYVVLVDHAQNEERLDLSGANSRILKPYDPQSVEEALVSAARLSGKVTQLGDDSLDFPSAGGVIAKSAFNQLFLSAIDRSDRYAESNYAVFITVSNYLDMLEKDGPYYADLAVAKLSQHLTEIRRQSDIIGQTDKNEYAFLLQRPQYKSEPVDAANRFAEEISKLKSIKQTVESDPQVSVCLVALPSGRKIADHHITLK